LTDLFLATAWKVKHSKFMFTSPECPVTNATKARLSLHASASRLSVMMVSQTFSLYCRICN
jgi:hypothetical protein